MCGNFWCERFFFGPLKGADGKAVEEADLFDQQINVSFMGIANFRVTRCSL